MKEIVYIIDDDASVREGLGDLLRSVGLEVLTFASSQEFLDSKRPDVPGCIILDVRLPGRSGLEFQSMLTSLGIELPVIFISAHSDIPISVRAMKAGAIEFLTKPLREQELLDAAYAGIERDCARRQEVALIAELRSRYDSLTPREREIMNLVVAGSVNKQIAAQVGLSEVTVKVHRGHVMQKMQARSLVDLVRMADGLGLSTKPSWAR
ncbi:response regulator nodulation protein NodW 2 (plasmid) [Rhizobium phaseoli]|uniref:Response regulator nodulation protein NodW 2 n=1 Tax=Rhizobium phaseoli TaxID=396 RepID=A0ABM6CKR9_9HYPH|nr:response regulator transcription factor [Rhizobium phaseoli]KEC69996.1 two-component nodulation response regulator protein [Rhizobium leguminosarum bv. phaseoli CCGM1]ANL31798.1 response regulator nodulation protein NodW 2 [Rhizobium phaseoli]ANL50890.1 response regulator nodulation protein NodW 2 [Rhizobium phaseoli]ANL57192.1 response regulator nodulation protein NodW 2 [Rhizobium phaseoli]ANL88966.1 response regulator nodulation protein NodW 2 [Rhizobium phaseoli]